MSAVWAGRPVLVICAVPVGDGDVTFTDCPVFISPLVVDFLRIPP